MFEKNQAVQLLIDPADGKIIDANSAAARFYGYSLTQFKSMNLSDISAFSAEQVIQKLSEFGPSGQSYFQFIHKLASGENCNIEIYTSLLYIGGRQLLISTVNDITKRKLEEERVNQLNNQLKEVNLLKSQFISTVSHEFRTPLAGILSSIQLLKIYNDIWDKEKKEKMYKQIFDAVQQTKSLLDDVSLIDKAQNSNSFFRPAYIELIPLINEII
jgi:PAS domain S-box-containing protein